MTVEAPDLAVHLGMDIGGTGSRWVACDQHGTEIARGHAEGATAHVFNSAERARLTRVLNDIAGQLAQRSIPVSEIHAGVTGYGPNVQQDALALFSATFSVPVSLIDDITAAYHAVFRPGEGHLVSAGTGSFGVYIAEDNSQTRIGGRGILIDDAGSGSWIALRALDCLYRGHDRDGCFDAMPHLARHIFAAIGGSDWGDVRQFVYSGDRGRIGTLAVAVGRAADDQDFVAIDLLTRAGIELVGLAETLIARAGPRTLAFIGGAIDLHPLIHETIRKRLPAQELRFPKPDTALAAARYLRVP
ncbi:N-acetylglucosamine kinase [Devosia ginsengisoli]|nr:BadF/BadG/BcrA/BcrD ATPase family protein [Devosia ginsengisoli]